MRGGRSEKASERARTVVRRVRVHHAVPHLSSARDPAVWASPAQLSGDRGRSASRSSRGRRPPHDGVQFRDHQDQQPGRSPFGGDAELLDPRRLGDGGAAGHHDSLFGVVRSSRLLGRPRSDSHAHRLDHRNGASGVRAHLADLRGQDGQAIVLLIAILTVLVGFGGLVLDGGRGFHMQRRLQTAADAAALAAVQDLPSTSTAVATTDANQYVQTNYNGATAAVTFPQTPTSTCSTVTFSCVRVVASKTAPLTLTKVLKPLLSNVTVSAKAMAAVTIPTMFKNVAPVAVKNTVACTIPSCFGTSKTVSFDESSVASSTIGLINLTCHDTALPACANNNNVGATDLRDWIINGFADARA